MPLEQEINLKLLVVGDDVRFSEEDDCNPKTRLLITFTAQRRDPLFRWKTYDTRVVERKCCNHTVNLSLWNSAGQEDYFGLTELGFSDTDIFLLMFSVVSRRSFDNAFDRWYPKIVRHAPGMTILLVGYDVEFREPRKKQGLVGVSFLEGCQLADRIQAVGYVECGTRDLASVNYVIDEALQGYVNKKSRRTRRILEKAPRKRKIIETAPKARMKHIIERIERGDNYLIYIYLYESNLGDREAEELAAALKKSPAVRTVDLRSNNIGAKGAVALYESMKANSRLMSIDLSGNKIGGFLDKKGKQALAGIQALIEERKGAEAAAEAAGAGQESSEEQGRQQGEQAARRKAEEEHRTKEAEAKRQGEAEQKRKQAAARKQKEEERKKEEAEARRQVEAEQKREKTEAEERRKAEEEHKGQEEQQFAEEVIKYVQGKKTQTQRTIEVTEYLEQKLEPLTQLGKKLSPTEELERINLNDDLDLMRELHQVNQRQLHQIQATSTHPDHVRVFRAAIVATMEEVLIKALAISKGLADRHQTKQDQVIESLSIAGDMLPIPMAGLFITAVATGYAYSRDRKLKQQSDFVTRTTGTTLIAAADWLKAVAKDLVEVYAEALKESQLSERGIQMLAQVVVKRGVQYLYATNPTQNTEQEFVRGVRLTREEKAAQASRGAGAGRVADKLTGLNKRLETGMQGVKITADDVLTCTGIQVEKDDYIFYYEMADDKENKAVLCGYRKGTDEEVRECGYKFRKKMENEKGQPTAVFQVQQELERENRELKSQLRKAQAQGFLAQHQATMQQQAAGADAPAAKPKDDVAAAAASSAPSFVT